MVERPLDNESVWFKGYETPFPTAIPVTDSQIHTESHISPWDMVGSHNLERASCKSLLRRSIHCRVHRLQKRAGLHVVQGGDMQPQKTSLEWASELKI